MVAGLLLAFCAPASAAPLGARVDNVATVSFTTGSGGSTITTSPASFVIEAARTPSTIEFFRYAPGAGATTTALLNGSDFRAPSGGFAPVGPLRAAGGALIDTSAPAPLAPANAYFPGEPIIVRVTDAGQNGDPARVETLIATIVTENGDRVTLRFYESGPDTGAFYAYVPSAAGAPTTDDPVLSIEHGATLTARYQDPFDATEVSTDTAGADPFGRVFDSLTGALVDGAEVTIVDAATGAPATVFGVDGVSAYPSRMITGQTVVDGSGLVYPGAPGAYRFPILAPGSYRIVVVPPAPYSAPSRAPPGSFAALPNAPFAISSASFGGAFALQSGIDVNIDVPIDPQTDILVLKSASTPAASIGDFVRYEIEFENRGATAVAARIVDRLPKGMRYQRGSARLGGAAVADPAIGADGSSLSFALGQAAPGTRLTLAYVLEVAAGVRPGTAVNRAQAVDAAGAAISNFAEAAIVIRDDFLRDRFTIVGRIVESDCTTPRQKAIGVEGVRVYLETGATTVTDENGLYHFDAVRPGTHVVQIDEASFGDTYVAVACRPTTRTAGSAISQFVEARGGHVWRADFYLKRVKAAAPAIVAPTSPPPAADYLRFDKAWLESASGEAGFVYPAAGATPSAASVNLGLKHAPSLRPTLFLNGRPVAEGNFDGRDVNASRSAALTRWRGVDLVAGENRFVAVLNDLAGQEVGRIELSVPFIEAIERASLSPERSRLVADGAAPVEIALRLTDGAGRPVRAGRLVEVTVDGRYRAALRNRLENERPLDAPLSTRITATVGADGVAIVALAPTLETGLVRLSLKLADGATKEIDVRLTPALRDWIVVGMAEGSAFYADRDGADGGRPNLLRDGRVAVFAKGAVKGGWLVTLAGDTDKDRGDTDDELFDDIDPDARYPLVGDRSVQTFEAQSRYPIFAKAEKDGFSALVGDYQTGLTRSYLSRYDRRLTGFQTLYDGSVFSLNGFVAETNQSFLRDELAADGTSGPYRLASAPLVRNSETVVIETRDRFRPDQVIATTPLARYADYDIDFETGVVILRLPAPAADAAFNPNVLVVNYETAAAIHRNVTGGGRAAVRLMGGRLEVGGSFVHEETPGLQDGVATDLAGVDVALKVDDATEIRVEHAASLRDDPVADDWSSATLAEIRHAGERLAGRIYYSQADQNFGVGQQSSATLGARRFGGEASYRLSTTDAASPEGARLLEAKGYREESLSTGATRSIGELALRQESRATTASVGLRQVSEQPAAAPARDGLFLIAAVKQRFEKLGLTLRASRDQLLSGDDASVLFPERTTIGFDQKVVDGVVLSASHEILDGANETHSNTIVGMTAQPWSGGKITVSGDRLTADSGERIGATFGLDQQVKLSDRWSASGGLARREDLKTRGAVDLPDTILPDRPVGPLEEDGAFTSLYTGLGYRADATTASARFELRKSAEGQRYMVASSAARELSEQLSFAAAGRFTQSNNETTPDERAFDARIGASWRPRDDGAIVFNRIDLKQQRIDGDSDSWKVVHNLAVNVRPIDRLELSFAHGLKYSTLRTFGDRFDALTEIVGLEARYDLTDRLDVGLHGEALYSWNAGTIDYAFGPSIGFTPAENIWFTFGWNFDGFVDDDFLAAEYSRSGPFFRLRVKFNQHTARGLLDRVTPDGVRRSN